MVSFLLHETELSVNNNIATYVLVKFQWSVFIIIKYKYGILA